MLRIFLDGQFYCGKSENYRLLLRTKHTFLQIILFPIYCRRNFWTYSCGISRHRNHTCFSKKQFRLDTTRAKLPRAHPHRVLQGSLFTPLQSYFPAKHKFTVGIFVFLYLRKLDGYNYQSPEF